jgi:hypothetical protein
MYTRHWNLYEKPFELTPDPKYVYYSKEHEEALLRLIYTVRDAKGAMMLTGGYGCGKTVLSRVFLNEMVSANRFEVALITNPRFNAKELLVEIIYQLGGERHDYRSKGELMHLFNDMIFRNLESRKETVIVIDEAQAIEDIKQHPLRSAEIVRPIFSERIASVIMDVHERENGQGYPRGIPGAEINLWAKIIAVVDAFEALTHPRIFRPAYSPYEAIKMIIKKKDVLFDDMVVKRFIDFMSIYPVGSLVKLNSGEVAIVTAGSTASPTRPVVKVILNENKEVEEANTVIDLVEREFVYITGVVEPEKEKELLYFLKPRGQVDLDEI